MTDFMDSLLNAARRASGEVCVCENPNCILTQTFRREGTFEVIAKRDNADHTVQTGVSYKVQARTEEGISVLAADGTLYSGKLGSLTADADFYVSKEKIEEYRQILVGLSVDNQLPKLEKMAKLLLVKTPSDLFSPGDVVKLRDNGRFNKGVDYGTLCLVIYKMTPERDSDGEMLDLVIACEIGGMISHLKTSSKRFEMAAEEFQLTDAQKNPVRS